MTGALRRDDGCPRAGRGSCTLFQRLDGDSSMVRAATTVVTAQGRRDVGSYIPAATPTAAPTRC
jgi:hypothetical protein